MVILMDIDDLELHERACGTEEVDAALTGKGGTKGMEQRSGRVEGERNG
jgi:hypothetical protein